MITMGRLLYTAHLQLSLLKKCAVYAVNAHFSSDLDPNHTTTVFMYR